MLSGGMGSCHGLLPDRSCQTIPFRGIRRTRHRWEEASHSESRHEAGKYDSFGRTDNCILFPCICVLFYFTFSGEKGLRTRRPRRRRGVQAAIREGFQSHEALNPHLRLLPTPRPSPHGPLVWGGRTPTVRVSPALTVGPGWVLAVSPPPLPGGCLRGGGGGGAGALGAHDRALWGAAHQGRDPRPEPCLPGLAPRLPHPQPRPRWSRPRAPTSSPGCAAVCALRCYAFDSQAVCIDLAPLNQRRWMVPRDSFQVGRFYVCRVLLDTSKCHEPMAPAPKLLIDLLLARPAARLFSPDSDGCCAGDTDVHHTGGVRSSARPFFFVDGSFFVQLRLLRLPSVSLVHSPSSFLCHPPTPPIALPPCASGPRPARRKRHVAE